MTIEAEIRLKGDKKVPLKFKSLNIHFKPKETDLGKTIHPVLLDALVEPVKANRELLHDLADVFRIWERKDERKLETEIQLPEKAGQVHVRLVGYTYNPIEETIEFEIDPEAGWSK